MIWPCLRGSVDEKINEIVSSDFFQEIFALASRKEDGLLNIIHFNEGHEIQYENLFSHLLGKSIVPRALKFIDKSRILLCHNLLDEKNNNTQAVLTVLDQFKNDVKCSLPLNSNSSCDGILSINKNDIPFFIVSKLV